MPSQPLRNYDDAIRVMQRATAVPKNTKVNYHDHVRPIGYEHCVISDGAFVVAPGAGATLQIAQALVILRRPRGVPRNRGVYEGRV